MSTTPEPITEIDGQPQYAQAYMDDGSVVIADTPPEIAADPAADLEAQADDLAALLQLQPRPRPGRRRWRLHRPAAGL
jgi:hypothetical protein